jgi:voltage-gated potassium channel
MVRPARQLFYGSVLFLIIVLAAVIGYVAIDGTTFLDAFYMVVLTVFGVGYGEVIPVESPGAKLFTILVIISGCTALLYILGTFIQLITEGQILNALGARRMTREISKLHGHVIVCGFGRIGQMLARELHEAKRPFVVVDKSAPRIEAAAALGYIGYVGEATDESALQSAGIDKAHTLATVLPDDAANVFITLSAINLNPAIEVIARGEEPSTEKKLLQAGARRVVLPAHIGAERIVHMILYPSAADFVETDVRTRHLNDQLGELGVHLEEIPVLESSPHVGTTISEIEIRGEGAFLVVALRRGESILRKPAPDTILEAGDRLIIVGHTDSGAELARKSSRTPIQYRGAKSSGR